MYFSKTIFKSFTTASISVLFSAVLISLISSCSGKSEVTEQEETPISLWICGEANFERLASKDSITYYLNKIKDAGFNNIIVDVKPVEGEVIYKSKVLPELKSVGGKTVERDWDYLEEMIAEARRIGLKVTASTCVFPAGSPAYGKGLCYDMPEIDSLLCVEYLPDGSLVAMKDLKPDFVFLNPVHPKSREIAKSVLKEIVDNYDIDGLSLDYCRFADGKSDFSDYTRHAFEQYLGHEIENWPADVFTYSGDALNPYTPGPYYKEWWAFRAGVISDFVGEISDMLHTLKPDVELNYWAASWLQAIQVKGQNWSSPRNPWCMGQEYGSPEYMATGFAPKLTNFIVGAYLPRVYGLTDNESIEFALRRANNVIMGDCHVIGSFSSESYSADVADPNNLTSAINCCLDNSEGLMIFDLVHVNRLNQWDQIKAAIEGFKASKKQ